MKRRDSRGTPRRLLMRGVLRILTYIGAFTLLFALDNTVESLGQPASANEVYSKLFLPTRFSLSNLYPYIVRFQSAHRLASHTLVVTLGKDEPINYANLCDRRQIISDAVNAIASEQPAVIGIDYNFVDSTCRSDFATELLYRALTQAASDRPVVLGQKGLTLGDLRKQWPTRFVELKARGFEEAKLFLDESVPFENLNNVRIGLAQLNSDNRKIPLSWHVMNASGRLESRDTFAFVVADAAGLPERVRVEALKQAGRHPIGSFFDEPRLSIISAIEIICSSPETRSHWPQCAGRSNEQKRDRIRGRAVILGLVDPDGSEDVHESLIGTVPGVMLQANYVEALLSNTYLRPVSKATQIAIGICWFIVIEFILRLWTGNLLRSVVYPLCLVTALWAAINVCLLASGYYIELLFPSILVVIVAHVSERIEELVKPNKEKPNDAMRTDSRDSRVSAS